MIKIQFTNDIKNQIHYERYNNPHPHVQRKMEVLWLKSKSLPHELICDIACISPNTLRTYLKDFKKGGLEKLKEVNFFKPKSQLAEFTGTIEGYFREHQPRTSKEAAAKIVELTGIKRDLTRIRKYLKSIGMSFRKVGAIPGKAIDEKKKLNKRTS